MPDRRWTDADRELVVDAIYDPLPGDPSPGPEFNRTGSRLHRKAERVLDALTAAGWHGPGDCGVPICTASIKTKEILACTYWTGPRHWCRLFPEHTGDHLCQCGVAFILKEQADAS